MPVTYKKIASVTVGAGGAANITFSSIPDTYTDLVVKASTREAGGTLTTLLEFNDGTGTNYSWIRIQGAGSGTPNSSLGSSVGAIDISVLPGSGDTASTFGSLEYYVPNYTASATKIASGDSVTENNGTAAYQRLGGGIWAINTAINAIILTNGSGQNFVQHSTATLYGISKS
jgi:hypothetical protein